jgi:hypothetical protein
LRPSLLPLPLYTIKKLENGLAMVRECAGQSLLSFLKFKNQHKNQHSKYMQNYWYISEFLALSLSWLHQLLFSMVDMAKTGLITA